MANGRLGYTTIPPYSSCVVYCNDSGSSASISVNSQVISSSGNTELTVGIGTTTSVVTSGITTVGTGATFNTIIGPSFSCSGSFTYCGSYVASQCNYFTNDYIASGPSGIGTTTSFVDPVDCYCRSIITGEIVNPALRLGECAYTGISSSNLMGIYPVNCCGVCMAFTHTEYTSKDANAAGILLTNPYCTCCDVLACDVCRCKISATQAYALAYDWYAIKCGYGMYCTAADTSFCHGILGICGGDTRDINFYSWRACCNQTQCTTSTYSYICHVFQAKLSSCWSVGTACGCWFAPCCTLNCGAFTRGVNLAASGGVGAIVLNFTSAQQQYTFFPMSCNLSCFQCSACWVHWFDACSTYCGSGLIRLCTCPSNSNSYSMKWLSYNPTANCVYFMLDDTLPTRSGIYSINRENLYSYLCKINSSGTYTYCCGFICDMTCYFTKVSDIPSVFSNSDLICGIRNLYKTSDNSWGIAIKNCDQTCYDTFTSTDLINWTKTTCTYEQRLSETFALSNSSACDCLFTTCNCFFGNVSCSGLTDYKVSANNYERTGVVISDGESVVINNNSCYTMNAQVWGYEG